MQRAHHPRENSYLRESVILQHYLLIAEQLIRKWKSQLIVGDNRGIYSLSVSPQFVCSLLLIYLASKWICAVLVLQVTSFWLWSVLLIAACRSQSQRSATWIVSHLVLSMPRNSHHLMLYQDTHSHPHLARYVQQPPRQGPYEMLCTLLDCMLNYLDIVLS